MSVARAPARFAIAGAVVLAAAWLGPLPALARQSFAAHMTMHMAVVAIACPLLAWGVAGRRFDPLRGGVDGWRAALFSPYLASAFEFVVVWAWHAPALHHLARHTTGGLLVEQAGFFLAGTLVWLSALGGGAHARDRAAAGVGGLLMTSMHMTLLGVLLALADRPLYAHAATASPGGWTPLQDQQLGGVVMLAVGGVAYLAGALALLAGLLRERREVCDG